MKSLGKFADWWERLWLRHGRYIVAIAGIVGAAVVGIATFDNRRDTGRVAQTLERQVRENSLFVCAAGSLIAAGSTAAQPTETVGNYTQRLLALRDVLIAAGFQQCAGIDYEPRRLRAIREIRAILDRLRANAGPDTALGQLPTSSQAPASGPEGPRGEPFNGHNPGPATEPTPTTPHHPEPSSPAPTPGDGAAAKPGLGEGAKDTVCEVSRRVLGLC